MKAEMIAVSTSAIGKVHQTVSVTLSKRVKKNAAGKTKIIRRNNQSAGTGRDR